ncbi:putative HTH-type transcriptional regulator/MT0914 [bacterium BMS3Abin02]|nr:putative HTH-type transcriptional regulator/MT0914 [bacterium BMS3Abin02]GBE21588.1 putative HTH-type transcriptional regulator/MT0914 [bacterium BMS3Bbin01]HDH26596.1 adenylate/guanylate cyclase domain-containing protein [Actinomycetota bacterium]
MLTSETMTLLFTDIEGSSEMWDRSPSAMADALARHDELITDAIVGHGGHIVKNKGDGFFAAFASAPDAVRAVVEAQRGIQAEPWSPEVGNVRVRMALHTGTVEFHDGDYLGASVNRVARIEGAAHGGQVLISASTRELVQDQLSDDVDIVDLGEHRLRGLSRPERIYQLTTRDLPSEFATLRTLDTSETNLPVPPTSFVGRTEELSEIDRLLANPDCRLLTLLGPGGIGKTRLAIEVAKRLGSAYPNGAHFVPLAPITSPDRIVPAVAEALRLTIDTHTSDLAPKDQLLDFLTNQSALMVMDNFEQVVEGAGLVAEVLGQAPKLRVLVTSRRRLGLQGEWTYEVPSLPYPTNGEDASTYPAVRLFVERARQADPTFEPTPEWVDVRRICHLVQGLPLAIELAAAWTPVLACKEIADEIEANLDFLTTTLQDVPARHRSARAVFDWSWNLLPPRLRDIYRQLSVFRGGFDRRAASDVAGATVSDLAELSSRSLVHREGTGRFSLHQMLQQFAAMQLQSDRVVEKEVMTRHARYFARLLEENRERLAGPEVLNALPLLMADMDNIRAATEWVTAHLPEAETVPFLRNLSRLFRVHHSHEGADTFAEISETLASGKTKDELAHDAAYLTATVQMSFIGSFTDRYAMSEERMLELRDAARRLGLREEEVLSIYGLGVSQVFREEWESARPTLESAVALARDLEDDIMIGAGLLWLGWVNLENGDPATAEAQFAESLDTFRNRGDIWGTAYALSKMALIADAKRDYTTALQHHLECFDTFSKLGDIGGQGYTLSRASMSSYALGDYGAAMRYGEESLDRFEQVGHRWGLSGALGRIGYAALGLGDVATARSRFKAGLERASEAGYTNLVLFAVIGLGSVLAAEGSVDEAAEILTFALNHPATPAIYRDIGQPLLDDVLSSLPESRRAAAQQRATDLDLDDATTRLLE